MGKMHKSFKAITEKSISFEIETTEKRNHKRKDTMISSYVDTNQRHKKSFHKPWHITK